jgi:hypothetical protein
MSQKPEDRKLNRAHDKIVAEFDKLHQAELAMLAKEITRLKTDASGNIAMTTENMRIRAQILEKYRALHNQWIEENLAPAGWDGQEIPATLGGQAAEFGKWYAQQGLKTLSPLADIAVVGNLQDAVTHVTSVSLEQHANLRQILTQGIMTPGGDYRSIMKQLEEGFGLRKGLAETVFRGTVMQSLRMTNAAAASELKTDWYQHTGPAPLPMPDGHEFCVDHYGETHTLEEWREIAAGYGGQGGVDPEYVLEYCGGYNCRHGLRPVAPDNVDDTRDEAEEYKIIQQEYLNELAKEENS